MAARKTPAKKAPAKPAAKTTTIEKMAEGEEKPKGRGGRNEGETNDDVAKKHDEIIQRKLRGQSYRHIGAKVGMHPDSVRKVYAEARVRIGAEYDRKDAVELVKEVLARYESWIEEAAEVADGAEKGLVIASVNSRVAIQRDIITLCQTTGILPADLGDLRQIVNARQTAAKIMAVLEEYEVDDEIIAAMHLAVTGEHLVIEEGVEEVHGEIAA